MMFVEHYPSSVWGDDIKVEAHEDALLISGVFPMSLEPGPDIVREYLEAPRGWTTGRTGKSSPHTQFANANADEKLIRFTERFGPVVVESLERGEALAFVARQGMRELRNEQKLYRAVLLLVEELEHEPPNIETIERYISEIADRVSSWPEQWLRERRLLHREGCQQSWFFGNENLDRINDLATMYGSESCAPTEFWQLALRMGPIEAGHLLVCDLVNTFPPQVRRYDRSVIEGPQADLTGGIRPLLYYILRREYVQRGRIGVCANTACRDLFEIERAGARFCSEECSRRQRQREYWVERGKKLRAKRLKRSKPAKHAGRKRR